jgi:periplasmic protein TonB
VSGDDRALIRARRRFVHLDGLTRPPPHFPHQPARVVTQMAASAAVHLVAVLVVLTLAARTTRPSVIPLEALRSDSPVKVAHIVFIAKELPRSGGGGGGGNRQPTPIRRAEGVGHDPITLRVATPSSTHDDQQSERLRLPAVLLDARPLASGTGNLPGLPEGGVSFGTSLGSGSGTGVGTGAGSGIGSGTGPGLGEGSGGGAGGGVYRPGGNVKPPNVVTQVKPKYTEEALVRKIQGTVILEMVVRTDGVPDMIHVIGPLDPGGLDVAAVDAARQWRFEPGRVGDTPVAVLVTLMLDFRIQ